MDQETLKKFLYYDPDTGVFTWKVSPNKRIPIGSVAGSYCSNGYHIQIKINKKTYLAHRLAWLYMYGHWPTNIIDHIDNNGRNNKLSNLRDTTFVVNSHNRVARGWQHYANLTNPYRVALRHNGNVKYLYFETMTEATNVYTAHKAAILAAA